MKLDELMQMLHVRRDSWSSDYESPIHFEAFEPTRDRIDPEVELPAHAWVPMRSGIAMESAISALSPLVVVDGIRKLHLRLFFRSQSQPDQVRYGGLGSLAVGALKIMPGVPLTLSQARLAQRPERYAFFCDYEDSLTGETDIPGVPLPFKTRTAHSDHSPNGPLKALHDAMRDAEDKLVNELMDSQNEGLLLVDGPLQRRRLATVRPVVGFVKTLQTQYLPGELQSCLYRLGLGERTPLFSIRNERLSWYLRLSEPGTLDHALSGLVRLEVNAPASYASYAGVLADQLSPLLPMLVAPSYKDPRSPQNLVPIAALEQDLRRCLGDEVLVRRRLEAYLYSVLKQSVQNPFQISEVPVQAAVPHDSERKQSHEH